MQAVDDRTRAEKELRLEEGVRHEVEDRDGEGAHAAPEEHEAELRHGRIRENLLDVVLRQRDGGPGLALVLLERLSPLAVILVVAADSDEEAAKVLEGYQQGRYYGMTEFATNLKQDRLLRRGLTVERAAAMMSAHIDVNNWNTLVVRHGFTKKEFERWLVDVSDAALLRK